MTTSLLYQNYLSSAGMLSATSYAEGRLGGVTPAQVGTVSFQIQGAYSGVLEAPYVVQIQLAGAGGGFSGTTYRWSADGGETYTPIASDLVPVDGVWTTFQHGIQGRFVAGLSLPYFVLGDSWSFQATRRWGVQTLIDWNRNTEFHSDTVADGATWDLYTMTPLALAPAACVIWDPNWTSSTSVRLQSSLTSDFAVLSYNQLLSSPSPHIVRLLTGTSAGHYWRLRFTVGTGQGDLRFSEWYLGNRAIVTPYRIGFRRLDRRLGTSLNAERLAFGQGVASPTAEDYDVTFGYRQDAVNGEYRTLHAVWEAVNDQTGGDLKPLYLVPDDTNLSWVLLAHWANDWEADHTVLDRYHVRALFSGLTRSLV